MGLEKELMKGWIEVAVLAMLRSGPAHGYRLVARMREAGGCALCPRPGNLYPILHRLERKGWAAARTVAATGRRKRRMYRLTAAGARALQQAVARCHRMSACLGALLKNSSVGRGGRAATIPSQHKHPRGQ